MLILICSGAALFYQITGSQFDPVKTIKKLQSENRSDEALDMTKFFIENNTDDLKALKDIESDLQYSTVEKLKSFTKGAIKGEVYDTYSGSGAVSSDLCVYGDIRDLSIQSWRYFRDEKTDAVVAVLSGLGIILSAKPFAYVIVSYTKNTVKYIRNVSGISDNNSILKKVLKGKLSLTESKLVFNLLKKTNGQYLAPQQYFQISAV